MYDFPIGVILDSFRCGFREGVKKAVNCGAGGLQMYVTEGQYAPENLSADRRREILDIVKSNGLVFSALCGDLGQGFGSSEKNPALIERSKRIIDLAKELETDIVTTHIGVVPADKTHKRYEIMRQACLRLSEYASSVGGFFAIETGPEPISVLKEFLDSIGSRGVAVNLDPANLVMVTGDDPVRAVYTLRDYIVHTHAKDGKKLREVSPEVIYGVIPGENQSEAAFEELPLGHGDVDFDSYLKALDEIGYQGFLTIEREVGDDPERDIIAAVEFLTKKVRG